MPRRAPQLAAIIRMPGRTGMQVLTALREGDWTLPVILWTGFHDADLAENAARLGATALLHKPFPFTVLVELVRTLAPMPT